MRRISALIRALPFAVALLVPATASADVTAFLGTTRTPCQPHGEGPVGRHRTSRRRRSKFEYANTNEDLRQAAPRLRTFMFNGLVQTPIPIAGLQFYGTAGGGGFRETLNAFSETNVGINVGGGVKMSLAGPLRLRFDYRVFTLQGTPLYSQPQRFYAGINLKF